MTTTLQPLLRVFALSTLVLFSLFSSIQSDNVSVKQFNAVGNGVAYDTAAIQQSIDLCANGGGGYVVFPPGNYLSGTIHLKNGVFLVLQEGAKLLASTRSQDYPDASKPYLVLAENAHDVSIGGDGVIHGQGSNFVAKVDPIMNVMKSFRPKLVGFFNCRNVLVSKVKLKYPAHWSLHFAGTKNATVADISIKSDFNTPDTNGIVVEDSRDMIITRSNIDTAGDGIVMMTNKARVDNIIGTQSRIRSKQSAIKLGDASWFDITRILFVDMNIVDSHRGIAMQMRDGGRIDNATFTNVNITTQFYDPKWMGNAEPITVTTCRRNSLSKPAGTISNLMFYNLRYTAENGVLVAGSNHGGMIHYVKFVRHEAVFKQKTNYPARQVDYRPGCQGLVNRNNAAYTLKHIDQIMELEDVHIHYDRHSFPQWRNPLSYNPNTLKNLVYIRFQSNPVEPRAPK